MKYLIIIAAVLIVILNSCQDKDISPPIITLIGDTSMTIAKNSQYTDPGAMADDDVDGDISSEIITSGSIDTAIEGTYYLYYNVSDAAGNPALEKSRKVKVLIF